MSFESLDGLFNTNTASTAVVPTPTPTAPDVEEPKEEVKAETPVEPKPSPLAEKIRADREARVAKQREVSEASDLRTKLAEAQEKLASFQNQADPIGDPVAWAKMRGMSKEDQALFAQSLLYDIVPDKAPADIRIRLFEAKQARDAAAKEKTEVERRNSEQIRQTNAMITQYAEDVESEVSTFTAGSHPNSEDWFGEDTESYVQSLLATARNLSDAANKAGRRVDISPSAVAKALEAEVSERMKRRDARAAARKPVAEIKPDSGKQPTDVGETASTKGLGGGGTPRPTAKDESERIRRAMDVVFGGR